MFFLLLAFPFFATAQLEKETKKRVDSLHKAIKSTKSSIDKVDAYSKLIDIYLDTNPNQAKKTIDELLKLNKSDNCKKCGTMGLFYLAHWYDRNGYSKKSLQYFEASAKSALEDDDFFQYQRGKAWKVQVHINANELKEAEKELNEYFIRIKNLDDKTGLDEMYFLYGLINYNKGFLKTSIENYIKADEFITNSKMDKPSMRIAITNNIAQVYKELGNYPKTIQYVESAYSQSIKVKDTFNIMNITLHKGVIETEFKNYKKALPYLTKSFDYFDKINFQIYKGSSALYLGMVYYELKNYTKSMYNLSVAEKIYREIKDDNSLAQTLSYIALNQLELNQLASAKASIAESKKAMSSNTSSPIYLEVLNVDVLINEKMGNLSETLKSIKERDFYKEKLEKNKNETNLNELETKYQTKKKEQELKLLSEKSKLQNTIYLSLLGLLIALGGFLFYGYRNKIKTAEKLQELNDLKSRFFANISHEFRTPLTLIKSPVQSLKSEIKNENQQIKLDLIDKNSNRMLELVDQLLELSKIDSGKLQLLLKEGNISTFLNAIVEPFEYQAKENRLLFNSFVEKTTENHHFDKDVIEKIVTNLLSNALKYTPENQTISFTSSIENKQLKIVVSNSTYELKKEDLPKLFERFYQKNETQKGVGIGLALVKELVELYQGKIETQLKNSILIIDIQIPIESKLTNALIVTKETQNTTTNQEIAAENELPVLLIVDDNQEIRSVLKSIFNHKYHILEAQDGEKALEIALKEVPDCIISDVMMPKLDGFEFTKAIKSNELTSFIPVILLTAKVSDEAHLEGLKSTADAYLTKPFNNEIVKETVVQLLNERKKLHDRYSQELILKPTDIVINSSDEKFLEKLQLVLDKELSNADYSADDFASFMGMSRMQLHRKLKSLLGVSTTEFLRKERIKMAATLLKKNNVTIAEIAYSVGFNDVSYFIRCFKEVYNCTPSEYQENN